MTYKVQIIEDSIADGVRLTTMQVTFPRFILAEFNTHRMLSRNSASSRAVPVAKRIEQVRTNPFVPAVFGRAKPGMQAGDPLDDHAAVVADTAWRNAAEAAAHFAGVLAEAGVHKQLANRVLEPFLWHTVVVTATDWRNFFAQRCHADAQPEMQTIACMMFDAMEAAAPVPRRFHLPYVTAEERRLFSVSDCRVYSAARCARVSYDRQGEGGSEQERYAMLLKGRHMSPFEHQAHAFNDSIKYGYSGNFKAPWSQRRKSILDESGNAITMEQLRAQREALR